MKKFTTVLMVALFLFGCQTEPNNPNFQAEAQAADYMHRSMKKLTDVIVHDIFSPPVASRIYAYSSIAGYEAMLPSNSSYASFEGQLTDFQNVPKPDPAKEYCYPLASVHAFLKVGKTLIFSEDKIEAFEKEIYGEFEALGVPTSVYQNSMEFGDAIATHVLAWADKDNYKQTRTFPKFNVDLSDETRWQPTPPDYMEGIEPSWRNIRPFVLDSAQQFTPPMPTEFSLNPNSQFFKETMEVYTTGKTLTEEQESIAKFWDCNPYVSVHHAHLMYATKKITPGGHWINIAAIAAKESKADFMKSIATYALTSIALADGFISCWDEKYRSNLVRPETVINKHIDEDWKPLLQTPPFPEYTSGHSVISSAAAIALTSIYGENFTFIDDSEEEFGLPPRSFGSFIAASEEAAVSRLYGGIHYMPAIENGVTQGRKLGRFIVSNVQIQAQVGKKE